MISVTTQIGGLTDFTSSESRLSRLLAFPAMVMEGPLSLTTIYSRAKRDLGLGHQEVVGRHIRLGERLGLIEKGDGRIRASDSALGLFQLQVQRGVRVGDLDTAARAYLFQRLFTVAPVQLVSLLRCIDRHPRMPWGTVVVDYFRAGDRLPWKQETIAKSLDAFDRSGKVPRLLEHKVSAMIGWLRDLSLVTVSGPFRLTPSGSDILTMWNEATGAFTEGIVHISARALGLPSSSRPEVKSSRITREAIEEAIAYQPAGSGLVSFDRAYSLTQLTLLLDSQIALEWEAFYDSVKALWREGRVRSIIMGRDGRPNALTLPESP